MRGNGGVPGGAARHGLRGRNALAAVAVTLALSVSTAGVQPDDAGWAALARPGAVGLMRHARAPGVGDPPNFLLGDCSTQRNLDAGGRAQARAIGEEMRKRGVRPVRVLTSQWCRARETAQLLGLGPAEPLKALNSFFGDRSNREAQTAALRGFLAEQPDEGAIILVTHQVNITALTGRGVASGEIVVVEVSPDGVVEVTGQILLRP